MLKVEGGNVAQVLDAILSEVLKCLIYPQQAYMKLSVCFGYGPLQLCEPANATEMSIF